MTALRSRIAPTPSGYLHVGNALSFALTWALVRRRGGSLHLRIDDLDAPRVEREFVEDIFRQLEWLGLDYDSGPRGPEELASKYSQRLRIDRYHEALKRLREAAGSRLFACVCTRSTIRAEAGSLVYPGTCRDAGHDLDVAERPWRLRFDDPAVGDFVVRRRDGLPGFHLVSVVDDDDLGVNFVVRGEDLRPSTACQIELSRVLPGSRFAEAEIIHHPVLPGPHGEKLSKSRKSSPLRELRESWKTPERIFRLAAAALGSSEPAVSASDLLSIPAAGTIVLPPDWRSILG